MNKGGGHKPSVAGKLLLTTALGWALWQTAPIVLQSNHAPEWGLYAWGIGAIGFAAGFGQVASSAAQALSNSWHAFRAFRPKPSDQTSDWLTIKEARKAGLTKSKGLFLGLLDGQPIFIDNFVHALCVAPSRSGKTSSLIIPAVLHESAHSQFVTDFGGDVTQQCAASIRNQGRDLITLDPANLTGEISGCYNPLQVILDDLRNSPQDAMGDCRSLAETLHPKPVSAAVDPLWGNGAQDILTFGLAATCALRTPDEANLPNLYLILCDDDEFMLLLLEARESDALGGELSKDAKKILSMWERLPKIFESFRVGALQSLVTFGPSSRIAPIVMHSTFDPAELKRRQITLTLACDPSRMDQYSMWLKVTIWATLKCLVRERNTTRVTFLLDEFTNYPLSGLPDALTGLASSGVHLLMVMQEIQEVVRVYGPQALKTILSQTTLKLFFGASGDTARMLADWLGEEDVTTESYALGTGGMGEPSLSIGRARRARMVAAKVREMPADETLAIIDNLPVARLVRAGFHEVEPWRSDITPSQRFGRKRHLGKTKMVIRGAKARATRAGRRKVKRLRRPLIRPLIGALRPLAPGLPVMLLGAAALIVLQFGWPHLLFEYTRSHSWCRYIGLPVVGQSFETYGQDRCPVIVWRK